jgi:two-component system, NtrC family, sensor kinase
MLTVEINTTPIYEGGRVIGLQGISRDITERRRAEEALRKTERYLSLILDSVPALIWQKDNDGCYRQVNQAYCDAIGLEKESIVGKTDYDLFPTDIADKYISDDQEVLRTRTARREIEEHHLKPSGEYG